MSDFMDFEKKLKKIKKFGVDNNVPPEEIEDAVVLQAERDGVNISEFSSWLKDRTAAPEKEIQVQETEAQTQQGLSFFRTIAPEASAGMEIGDAGQPPDPETARMVTEVAATTIPTLATAGVAGLAGIGLRAVLGAGGAFAGSLMAEEYDPSEDPIKRASMAAAWGAAGEVGGDLVGKGISSTLSRLGKTSRYARPGAKQAQAIINDGGETLLAHQAVDNPFLNVIASIAESNPLGTFFTKRAKAGSKIIAEEAADEFVDHLGRVSSRQELGSVIQEVIENEKNVFKDVARAKFGKVDKLLSPKKPKVELNIEGPGIILDESGNPILQKIIKNAETLKPGEGVDISGIQKKAKEFLKKEAKRPASTAEAKRMLKNLINRPSVIPFEDAQLLRSDYLGAVRSIQENIPGRSKGIAKLLAKDIDKQMEKSAKSISEEAYAAWREASSFWKGSESELGISDFNSRIIKKITNEDPVSVYDTAIKPGNVVNIRQVKKLLKDSPEAMSKIRGVFVGDIFQKARKVNPLEGEFIDGASILNQMKAMRSKKGGDALSEILTKTQENNLVSIANAISLANSTPETPFKVIAQITQGGAMFAVATSVASPKTTMVLLTPGVAGKLISSPRLVNMLMNGAKWAKAGKTLAAKRAINSFMSSVGAMGGIVKGQDNRIPLNLPPQAGN